MQSLNKMIDCLRAVVHSNSLKSLCSVLARESKKAINAEKCTIFIINHELQKLYAENFGDVRKISKVRCGNAWLYVHSDTAEDFQEPIFTSVNSIIKGARSDDAIMRSITLNKSPYIGIQVTSPLERAKPEFTGSDDQKIKIICELAAVKLDALLNTFEIKTERKQMSSILEICSELALCRDHRTLSEKVSGLLPSYFQVAKASIAFLDSENSEFFVSVAESTIGNTYTDEVARFPSSIGLSGSLLAKGGIMSISDMKTHRKNYHPEMDNLAGVSDIRNMMLACLPGRDNEPVGVLQLVNKVTEIKPEDIAKLQDCFRLIGASIFCANTVNECLSLVIQIKTLWKEKGTPEIGASPLPKGVASSLEGKVL